MPIPKTTDVGSTISFLKKEKPGMPRKQKVAIALETARQAGANIPRKKKRVARGIAKAIRRKRGSHK